MWHPCAECTASIRFVEAGALHIQSPTPEIYSYQSFEQLEQLLTSLRDSTHPSFRTSRTTEASVSDRFHPAWGHDEPSTTDL